MPYCFTVAEAPDRFTVYFDIGDNIDFWQTLDEPSAIFLDRRPVKIAEAAAECDQVLIAQRLPANQQYRMSAPSVHQLSEHPVIEVSQINASHLGSERRAGRNHVERACGTVVCSSRLCAECHFRLPL